jgi:selenocysteine-specific elongation factor
MRRFVLGTAGHVDHGKTTLVQALTGVDTDRLPEEKRRGITIELGFAPWRIAEGMDVSIIDVPGHRRFVHTMIAGAAGIELVLLVVAADEGVMPQTREHIAACELLGIRRAVVAVTKEDRVGRELAILAGEEARELLGERFEAEIVPCSARARTGLDDVRAAVERAPRALPPPPASSRARLHIDRAFSIRGSGTVVTGTLVEGELEVGRPLSIVGGGEKRATAVRGLHVHDQPVSRATSPTRLAVNLASVSLEDFDRGDLLTDDATITSTRVVDVELTAAEPLKHGRGAQLYAGTARASAKVGRAAAPLPEEEVHLLRLRLHRALPLVGGDRFVLRGGDVGGPSGAVLGGGRILDAHPPPRRPRPSRWATLRAAQGGDPTELVRALCQECAPRRLDPADLSSRFPIARAALERAADKLADRGELTRDKAGGWILRSAVEKLAQTARRLVAEHQRKAPLDRGLGLQTLRGKLAAIADDRAAELAITLGARATLAGEPLVVEGDVVRIPSLAAKGPGQAVEGALGAARGALEQAALKGMSEHGLVQAIASPVKEVRAIVAKLVREGDAVRAGELWFWRPAVDDLRQRVVAHISQAARITIAEFKDLSGLGRKQAIVLLELLDREGTTRREGDDRVLGRKSQV